LNRILDYAVNTPMDPLRSALCVEQRIELIEKNRPYWNQIWNNLSVIENGDFLQIVLTSKKK